jgi:hypothetical protein
MRSWARREEICNSFMRNPRSSPSLLQISHFFENSFIFFLFKSARLYQILPSSQGDRPVVFRVELDEKMGKDDIEYLPKKGQARRPAPTNLLLTVQNLISPLPPGKDRAPES